MRSSAFLAVLIVSGVLFGPSTGLRESRAQWEEIAPIIRGQNYAAPNFAGQQGYVGQPPVVYFDQDPSTAIMGPPPAGTPGQVMGGYGATNANCVPMGMGSSQYIGVFGEFLYLHPRGADVAFGVPQDGTGGLGTVPVGEVGIATIGYTPAFRAGGFFTIGEDALVELTYSHFDSNSTTTISATAPNVINPLTLFPGTFNAGFTAESATAEYGINFQFIDADYMVMACNCDQFWLGYLLGARYAELGQEFTATYPFAAPDGTTTLDTNIDFTGVGMRFGVLGERVLFQNTGFRFYGSGIANLLVGTFDATYTQTNQFNGVEAAVSISETRIVPVVDLELGLAWLGPKGHFRLSAGYMVSAWFNAVTTPEWIASVQNRTFSPGSDVLTFDGLTARAQLAF